MKNKMNQYLNKPGSCRAKEYPYLDYLRMHSQPPSLPNYSSTEVPSPEQDDGKIN